MAAAVVYPVLGELLNDHEQFDALQVTPNRKLEVTGHHADDRVGVAVERQRATDDPRVTAEPILPETVGQHHDPLAAQLVFLRQERAT